MYVIYVSIAATYLFVDCLCLLNSLFVHLYHLYAFYHFMDSKHYSYMNKNHYEKRKSKELYALHCS